MPIGGSQQGPNHTKKKRVNVHHHKTLQHLLPHDATMQTIWYYRAFAVKSQSTFRKGENLGAQTEAARPLVAERVTNCWF